MRSQWEGQPTGPTQAPSTVRWRTCFSCHPLDGAGSRHIPKAGACQLTAAARLQSPPGNRRASCPAEQSLCRLCAWGGVHSASKRLSLAWQGSLENLGQLPMVPRPHPESWSAQRRRRVATQLKAPTGRTPSPAFLSRATDCGKQSEAGAEEKAGSPVLSARLPGRVSPSASQHSHHPPGTWDLDPAETVLKARPQGTAWETATEHDSTAQK